ncbi:capsid assembly protein [Sinorhizobium medicae]|uniref:capsid assembly protein n=1 Tax=Sinorhizobium medicae TaxID=110321 RepID=UPI000FDC0C6D|nr:capsid assembly protein [Sinorhizobium medicae]RVH83231.1 capsid assembly protein [Sinorhizobium medicae]RVP63872.1 capsid assembly protein [Sinorhizobium medicae]
MAEQHSVVIQSSEPTAEETAAALAAAAAAAPTNEEEARAKIAAEAAAAQADPQRPEGLPEKFKSWEDMAKAYGELEKKVGAPVEEPKTEGAEEPKAEEETEKKDDEVPGKVDLNALSTEFETDGKLSDASYADLEAKGYDRATVDQYIAGQNALAELATQRITGAAGGKESMDRMFAWATTSLTADEINTFNASFGNSDVNAAVIAMEQLKGKYEAANGRDPKLLGGKPAGAAVDVFGSWAEVTEAMNDARYASDHAYRSRIEAKLGRSNNIR